MPASGRRRTCKGRSCAARRWASWGLGRIGLEVAKRAKGFGLEIVGSDPFVSAAVARESGIKLVTLDELIAMSDYLTLHVGLDAADDGRDQR